MKYLCLITTVFMFQIGFAQDFIPMLQEGNQWSIGYGDGFSNSYLSYDLTVDGEIVINGLTYKTLIRNSQPKCLLREENGVVYIYDHIINDEEVLLNFNLEIGDIFDLNVFKNDLCFLTGSDIFEQLILIDVYTEFIAGEDRKVMEFEEVGTAGDPFYKEYWIEGIGSTAGFAPGGYYYDFGTDLICFTKDGETTFFNNHNTCVYELGIDDFNKNQSILSPNPVTHISVLQFTSEGLVDTVKIFDVSGRLVQEEKVTQDQIHINAMDYRSGLYFYQVYSKKQLLATEKFIVQ